MVKEKTAVEKYIDGLEIDVGEDFFELTPKADIIFKYMLLQNSVLSEYLRNMIIYEVTGIKVKSTKVVNAEMLPNEATKKTMHGDVMLEDETKRVYDLEMQIQATEEWLGLRFQIYVCRIESNRLMKGELYKKIRPSYAIVFLDYLPEGVERLTQNYQLRDEGNVVIKPFSVLNITFIYMPYIHTIVKEKTFEELSKIEKICYLYKMNINSDIIKSKEREVKAFLTLYMEIRKDENLWYRLSEEMAERDIQMRAYDKAQKVRKEGLKEGLKKGLKEGKVEAANILLTMKYNVNKMAWLKTLHISQIEALMRFILSCDTFEELKLRVEKNN